MDQRKCRIILRTVCASLALLTPAAMRAQGMLISPLSDAAANLSTEQAAKLSGLRTGRSYASVICVQVGSLKDLQIGGNIAFELPGYSGPMGDSLQAVGDHIEYTDSNNYSYSGHFVYNRISNGELTIVKQDGAYHGQIRPYGSPDMFELWDFGNSVEVITRFNASQLTGLEELDPVNKGTAYDPGHANQSACIPNIRVLVCYTNNAKNSVPNIDNTIDGAIAILNGSMTLTFYGVKPVFTYPNFELADKKLVSFSESNNIGNDVTNSLPSNSTIAGYKAAANADIVILLAGDNSYGGAFGQTNMIAADASHAYAIVTAPSAYAWKTFAHEVGHIMGARHQQCSLFSTGSGCDNTADNTHGYHWTDPNPPYPNFAHITDVMHQLYYGQRMAIYSTPSTSYSGAANGVASTNNAADVIYSRGCAVASFINSASSGDFRASISAPNDVVPGGAINATASLIGASTPNFDQWFYSTDGFNYTQATPITANNTSYSTTMPASSHLWLKFVSYYYSLPTTAYYKIKNTTIPLRRFQASSDPSMVGLTLFPQPARNEINFEMPVETIDQSIQATIIDMTGKVLLHTEYPAQVNSVFNAKMDLRNLQAGTYILQVQAGVKRICKILSKVD